MKILVMDFIIIGFLILYALIFLAYRPPLHYTCQDFRTQAAAQQAYDRGAFRLDGDRDRRACEQLP